MDAGSDSDGEATPGEQILWKGDCGEKDMNWLLFRIETRS